MKCPICGKNFTPSDDSHVLPFCSTRCKMIDTKRWLNEEYSVATINKELLEDELEAEIARYEQTVITDAEKN